MDALTFIEKSTKTKPAPMFAVTGDEDFLRREARAKLVADLLEDADPEFAVTAYPGESAAWATVKSELETLPFLAPRRVVVIEQADTFVTDHRSQLEKYVADGASRGVLILEVKKWPSNTRLAKALGPSATIVAGAPFVGKLPAWCRARAKSHYQCELASDAAEWLVEIVAQSMGVLDQELAKLAAFVGNEKVIRREHVDQMVGRSRNAEVFKIFDVIGQGKPAAAMTILRRLYDQDEEPLAILGAVSWQLRRLGAVSRLARAGLTLQEAFNQAGVQPFARGGMETLLRHLGRARMDRVYDWLLEIDLGMKGGSTLPDKLQLERLIVKLARVDKPMAVR